MFAIQMDPVDAGGASEHDSKEEHLEEETEDEGGESLDWEEVQLLESELAREQTKGMQINKTRLDVTKDSEKVIALQTFLSGIAMTVDSV